MPDTSCRQPPFPLFLLHPSVSTEPTLKSRSSTHPPSGVLFRPTTSPTRSLVNYFRSSARTVQLFSLESKSHLHTTLPPLTLRVVCCLLRIRIKTQTRYKGWGSRRTVSSKAINSGFVGQNLVELECHISNSTQQKKENLERRWTPKHGFDIFQRLDEFSRMV